MPNTEFVDSTSEQIQSLISQIRELTTHADEIRKDPKLVARVEEMYNIINSIKNIND